MREEERRVVERNNVSISREKYLKNDEQNN
jgi:hypothetical protein